MRPKMRRFPHPELQLRKRLALHASQGRLKIRTVHICMDAPALKKYIKLEFSIEKLLNGEQIAS